jgi:non-specific protein-tyrosine kinase
MERIERALEIARLQRSSRTEPAAPPAAASAAASAAGQTTPAAAPAAAPLAGIAPHHIGPAPVPRAVRADGSVPAHSPGIHPEVHKLPRHPIRREELRDRRVLLADDPGTAARAYRMLRAQLLHRARTSRMRAFGIVSAVCGEGKTITAINLALSLTAEPNQRVALLDFDLSHPSIAQTLGIAPLSGLDTWLTDGTQPASAVLCELEGIARLHIAPTLAPLSHSSERLAGQRARALLEELRQDDGRLLIVDLPPALLSHDVLTVAPLVDGFILVVTEGKTRREDVERVIELIGRERIVGTVLNGSIDSEQRAY